MAEQDFLFNLPPVEGSTVATHKFTALKNPIWTRHKAQLIQRYLFYFVQITRHGTYIDGFAGPQEPEHPEMWAAKLVLENEPRWLRHFYLFERNRNKLKMLRELRDQQPPPGGKSTDRTVEVLPGDFNEGVHEILTPARISETEATFCLLDQHTFECKWSTIAALASHKKTGCKIEIFYFFPQGWLNRSLAAQRDLDVVDAWWGNSDWKYLKDMSGLDRANLLCRRMKDELGYTYAYAWPIFGREDGGRIMYYMIHASDHKEAPRFMHRAYQKVVDPMEEPEQIEMEFEEYFQRRHIDTGPRPSD